MEQYEQKIMIIGNVDEQVDRLSEWLTGNGYAVFYLELPKMESLPILKKLSLNNC